MGGVTNEQREGIPLPVCSYCKKIAPECKCGQPWKEGKPT